MADELRATTLLLIRDGDEAVLISAAEPHNAGAHSTFHPGTRYASTGGGWRSTAQRGTCPTG